jgi:hypothetical protein
VRQRKAARAATPARKGNSPPTPTSRPFARARRTFIIERKDRKIAKLQGEDGADAEDQTDIRSIIQQELAPPLKATFAKSADDQELQAALARYPEAKKMETTVRRYMENPAYAQIPVDFIVRGLLGAKEGAKKQADDEARGTRQGGHTRRPQEKTLPDFTKMTDEEFLAYDRKNR